MTTGSGQTPTKRTRFKPPLCSSLNHHQRCPPKIHSMPILASLVLPKSNGAVRGGRRNAKHPRGMTPHSTGNRQKFHPTRQTPKAALAVAEHGAGDTQSCSRPMASRGQASGGGGGHDLLLARPGPRHDERLILQLLKDLQARWPGPVPAYLSASPRPSLHATKLHTENATRQYPRHLSEPSGQYSKYANRYSERALAR